MRVWVPTCLVVLLSAAFAGVLSLPGLSNFTVLLLSNGGQLAAVVAAAVACAGAAHRRQGRQRRAWLLLSLGTASWALGQVVWTYYEVVLGREVPFPSLADVGFVAFPLVTAVGLLSWWGSRDGAVAWGRDLLDGAIIAGSLVALSWVTTLGAVVGAGGENWLSISLSLGYPIGDVVLATLVLLALARDDRDERGTLLLVAAGLGGLALADSAYVYLVTVGSYSSGDLISVGWATGFLLVAAGALLVRADDQGARAPRHRARREAAIQAPTRLRIVLPYLPLSAAALAICARLVSAPVTPLVELGIGIALTSLVMVRQFLAMTENHRLLAELAVVRDQLQHQALHDPLTGLANRALFADRVGHALAQPDAEVGVLFCDLDDFKVVNDELGHDAGDMLLRLVAERLLSCVRPADTVARLGGDEFAILLERADDAGEVADRVVRAVDEPYPLHNTLVHASVSVGVAQESGTSRRPARERLRIVPADVGTTSTLAPRRPPSDDALVQQLLRRADQAMYAAKAAGKGRAVRDARSAPASPAAST